MKKKKYKYYYGISYDDNDINGDEFDYLIFDVKNGNECPEYIATAIIIFLNNKQYDDSSSFFPTNLTEEFFNDLKEISSNISYEDFRNSPSICTTIILES